jgi:hypothetical protein
MFVQSVLKFQQKGLKAFRLDSVCSYLIVQILAILACHYH